MWWEQVRTAAHPPPPPSTVCKLTRLVLHHVRVGQQSAVGQHKARSGETLLAVHLPGQQRWWRKERLPHGAETGAGNNKDVDTGRLEHSCSLQLGRLATTKILTTLLNGIERDAGSGHGKEHRGW